MQDAHLRQKITNSHGSAQITGSFSGVPTKADLIRGLSAVIVRIPRCSAFAGGLAATPLVAGAVLGAGGQGARVLARLAQQSNDQSNTGPCLARPRPRLSSFTPLLLCLDPPSPYDTRLRRHLGYPECSKASTSLRHFCSHFCILGARPATLGKGEGDPRGATATATPQLPPPP